MSEPTSTIFVVDDDPDSRDSLVYLLQTVGLQVRAFASALEFLHAVSSDRPGCLVCDVRMPEISGLELFEQLTAAGYGLPVIFITAYADVPMAVRALKSGAAEFVEKPFNANTMLEKIQRALGEDRRRRQEAAVWNLFQTRLASLTDKERETLDFVLEGTPNKAIAGRLNVTERAVEMRRATLMKKLQARSVAELIRWVTEHELAAQQKVTDRAAR